MADGSKIEWCHATFNTHIGCTKVSDACTNCYAETLAKRYGWAKWGAGETRKRTSESNWRTPLSWDRAAKRDGFRRRVFCNSLSDVFDAEVPDAWRDDLFTLAQKTQHLDWLLLTKRPQVARKYFEPYRIKGPPSNVWLGTTVEDQKMADLRIPILLSIPARVHFLSCEPPLGPIDLRRWLPRFRDGGVRDFESDRPWGSPFLDWIIAGGESGPHARPSHPDWFRSLRDQCQADGVAFFMKQMTNKGPIPTDLFVREFPDAA